MTFRQVIYKFQYIFCILESGKVIDIKINLVRKNQKKIIENKN